MTNNTDTTQSPAKQPYAAGFHILLNLIEDHFEDDVKDDNFYEIIKAFEEDGTIYGRLIEVSSDKFLTCTPEEFIKCFKPDLPIPEDIFEYTVAILEDSDSDLPPF